LAGLGKIILIGVGINIMDIFEGDIVKINLSTLKVEREPSSKYFQRFPGGRGLNQYLLFKELLPGTTPFEPANVIAFGAGLLTGTGAPSSSRLSIDSLNVQTGGIGSSNCGGNFASTLRAASINNLLITGRSKELVFIYIENENIKIINAANLRGKGTVETEIMIKDSIENSEVEILSIGPAGENMVRSACIMVNTARAAGRCGLGAVIGSKNLKAIVVSGNEEITVRNKEAFASKVRSLRKKLEYNPIVQKRKKYGVYFYHPWVGMDETPYRNFQGGILPPENITEKIYAEEFLKYKTESKCCKSCPIKCWSVHEIDNGGRKIISEGMQGNEPHNFGAKLNIFDAKAILKGHAICNDLGLDSDNACGVIAWAFECYQRNIITEEDTFGLRLEWGNQDTVFKLLSLIAYREDFGDILAEGSKRAAKLLGGSDYSINIKGQELMESLRSSVSWALGVSVSARGGTHTRGAVIEGRLKDLDPDVCKKIFKIEKVNELDSYENKEHLVFYFEILQAMLDSLGICMFTNSLRLDMLTLQDYAELYYYALGEEVNIDKFIETGERIHNLEKCFNVLHQGWTAVHDYPPDRFFDEPIENGPRAGQKLDRQKWSSLLEKYYKIHGWDSSTSWPLQETLERLQLEDLIDKLKEYNRIP